MRKILSIFTVITLLVTVSGCDTVKENPDGYTFTDDLGRRVIAGNCDRVASLLGSFADLWMLAGGTVCATADVAWEDFSLPLSEEVINLGSTHKPSKEELLAAKPTLVFASSKLSKHLEMRETLESAGITVAYFDVGDFASYLHVLKIMTDITGRSEYYEKYGIVQQNMINAVLAKHTEDKPQTVLVMRASAASIRAKNSEDTMLGGMLRDFGCINIADSDSMLLDNLSIESILLKNPDKLFFIETGDDTEGVKIAVENMFKENPLWYELDAVKNGKVYYMDKQLYNLKPNARFAEAYEKLEKILYEE